MTFILLRPRCEQSCGLHAMAKDVRVGLLPAEKINFSAFEKYNEEKSSRDNDNDCCVGRIWWSVSIVTSAAGVESALCALKRCNNIENVKY